MPESTADEASTARGGAATKFGSLLRELRAEAGLSQDALAERAGISAKTIGALEQGVRRAAHDDTIHRIAEALALSISDRDALLHSARRSRARRYGKPEEAPRTNLPTTLTSFVNRREIEDIVALLDRSRLVTITGSGGVGKTRTAIEVARQTAKPSHGLWFVDLSTLRESNAVLPELVSALGVRVSSDDDAYDDIVRHLNAYPSRLLLDNCEHLLDGLAGMVPRLLQSCPHLSILATSREPLLLSFEAAYRLPSLDVPVGAVTSLDQALRYSALMLFLERTEGKRAAWLVTPQSLDKLAVLCRRLDGIPLAIELAASRVATLGLDMLLDELTNGLTLSGSRDAPERHRTMEATIAWSYDLLDSTEKTALRRLSVFAGSFSLDVARRVCADADLPAYTIVDACHRLAQKSLLTVQHGDPVRYRLLAAIREFAEARLSPGERDAVQSRYIGWLRDLSNSTHGAGRTLSTNAKKLEFDNVRAGVHHCFQRGGYEDLRDAAAIVGRLWDFWFESNRSRELKHDVEYLLDRLDAETETHLVSRLLLAACAYSPQRDLPEATARAVPVLVADGNGVAASRALGRLANMQFRSGEVEAAAVSLREAFDLLRDVDPAQSVAYWNHLLERAWQSVAQGDIAEANADLEQLATYVHDETDPGGTLRRRIHLVAAETAFVSGDVRRAISLLTSEFIDLEQQTPIYRFLVNTNLTMYHAVAGNADAALHLIRTTIDDLVDLDSSSVTEIYHYLLIPAALIAMDHERPRFAAIVLGHWNHHGRRGRTIWKTEAPGYDRLVARLRLETADEEMRALLDEGAAIEPDAFLDFLESESLFALA